MLRSAILLLSIVCFFGCTKEENKPLTPAEELDLAKLNTSLEAFQWNLFQKVVAQRSSDENLNISPLSIAAALYMAYEGSDQQTRTDISRTLSLPQSEISFNLGQAYENLILQLEESEAVSTANAVFWDKTRIFPHAEFLNYTKDYFDAGAFDLVFQNPDALTSINNWVKSSTKNRIEKIIDEISNDEVMFLINALYFKDDWKFPFPLESTQSRDFTTTDGTVLQAEMMHQDINTLRYYQGNDFQAVQMPFADTAFNLTLLLPPSGQTPSQLVENLTAMRLNKLLEEDLKKDRILLDVPKFEIDYKILLNEVLKDMGMEIAFDRERADFSRLGHAPEGNLFISKVNHKTYLKIDEKGAEGAAVTSVGIAVTSLPPHLNFNRPFVFFLQNRKSKTLIFAGIIEDPTV